jgi:hypothetical protein
MGVRGGTRRTGLLLAALPALFLLGMVVAPLLRLALEAWQALDSAAVLERLQDT